MTVLLVLVASLASCGFGFAVGQRYRNLTLQEELDIQTSQARHWKSAFQKLWDEYATLTNKQFKEARG